MKICAQKKVALAMAKKISSMKKCFTNHDQRWKKKSSECVFCATAKNRKIALFLALKKIFFTNQR